MKRRFFQRKFFAVTLISFAAAVVELSGGKPHKRQLKVDFAALPP